MIATPTDLTVRGHEQARPATPNDIAQALTGRPYITHSEVTSFQACPLKWHFGYVEHAEPETLTANMLVGTCTHGAIQRHLEALMAADRLPSIDELMGTYRQSWQEEAAKVPVIQFARDDTAQTLEATARQMVETYLASPYAKPVGEVLGIEETLKVGLGADLPDLCGRVDMIEHRPVSKELIITDYKTTRSMWSPDTADDHAQQLVLYAHATAPMAQELGATIRLQFVVITRAKTPKIDALAVPLDPARVDRTRMVLRQVFQAMQAGAIYPAPSVMNCSGCGHKHRCAKWHESAAAV
jgi:RecB family exonuclease